MSAKHSKEFLYKELSHQVLGCAFKVHSTLGCGLPEHNYEAAMTVLFDRLGLYFTRQERHDVYFERTRVGFYISDLIVERKIILELKSDDVIHQGHLSQTFTYMRITRCRVAFVLAFGGKSLIFKRLIL